MEFLRVVEEELRGLAAEARRRYPVVQEAAERAILKLRNMREEYVVALRQQHGGKAPPLSMFRSQDLLRPFLLACNHGDASPHLMTMAMGSIQYLINRDAILPSDAPNILRVLAIQSQSKDADVQKRVLQTMVMVVTWKSCDMTEDTISQAMGVCLGLHDAKNAMVRTAADMTVRQVISLLFDRVAEELGVTPDQSAVAETEKSGVVGGKGQGVVVEEVVKERGSGTGEGALRCAHLVFQDLCILSRGEQGHWMKRTSVTITLGLELVEQVLSQQPMLFRRFEVLRRLLSQEVSPLILQTLRRRMEFPLLVRLLRAASTLCVGYGDLLPRETRSILSTLLASLGTGVGSSAALTGDERDGNGSIVFSEVYAEGAGAGEGGSVTWAAMLTLEAVHRVLTATPVVLELFRHGTGEGDDSVGGGDEMEPSGKRSIVEEMLQAVSRYLLKNLSGQHSIQALETMAQSIRLGRAGGRSSSSADKKEARRLPVPASIIAALAREVPPPESSSASGGAGAPGTPVGDGKLRSGSTSGSTGGSSSRGAMKSSSADLLHESDKPSLDDAELLLWALQCAVDFSSALLSLVETELGILDPGHVIPSSACLAPEERGGAVPAEGIKSSSKRELLRRICECLWKPVLYSLSHVMTQCSDPLLVSTVVDGYKSFTVAAAILGVENAVDGFMGSLCRFSLPQWHGTSNAVIGGSGQGATATALSWNHVGILQSILQMSHRLGNLLRSSWHVVLDTFEQAVALLIRRAIARPRWTPNVPDTELVEVERYCVEVLEAAERLVQYSSCLEDEALYTLMSSLQALTVMGLANTATVLPQERNASREVAQSPSVGGTGSAAVAAATGLVSLVGAAARGVGAAMSEGRDAIVNRDSREKEARNHANAKSGTGAGDFRSHSPWVSSRLASFLGSLRAALICNQSLMASRVYGVVECAAANTWRLPVVWELVSGHLRVVAKAREPATREYAVRSLRELVVDGVQRLHPNMSRPTSQRQLLSTTTTATTPRSSATRARAVSATPSPASKSGAAGAGSDEGFIPTLLGFRGRSGDFGGEDERFRWVFDANVSGVFVSAKSAVQEGGLVGGSSDGQFEAVLFETMGLFALTPHVDTREATLQTLYTILQSCGQVLDSAWLIILNLLHSVAKGATDTSHPSGGTPSEGKDQAKEQEVDEEEVKDDGVEGERVSTWGGACLSLAFKCLQLIVDDFLEKLPLEQVPKLVTCVGGFGGQTESVNLSLTAIGMLWTVCDTFADVISNHVGGQGTDKAVSPSIREDRPALHSMWPTMLFELRSLAVDFRPELRNCAVNTLFSAAVGNGSRLSEDEWKQFLLEVTFPLLDQVLESTNSASKGANTAVAPELKKGVRMLMHHTRDTDQKQWNETRVLAMQGLGRVLRAYVGHLARWEWFSKEGGVWAKSLQLYQDACLVGSDSQEVALAGIDGITTLVLLVGRTGFNSVQVRAGAGMKIVDGTLQRTPAVPSSGSNIGKSPRSSSARKGTAAAAAAAEAAAVAAAGGGMAMNMTPEFTQVRPVLYQAAWEAMVEASKFEVDDSGDVAPAFVQGIATVYKAGMEEGAEFCPGQEGEPKRARQMFQVLDSLFLPRVPQNTQTHATSNTVDPAPRRTVYLPKVTSGQRAILDFLQEDLRSGWRLALRLLAKYSIAAGDPETYLEREGLFVMEGAENPAGVTVECRKDATEALSAMMSDRLRVPPRERALAFEGLLSEVSGPCLRRLEDLRRTLPSKSMKEAEKATKGAVTGAEALAALRWPSRDRCTEIMQLLLALLSDGLTSLSSEKDALQSQDSDQGIKEDVKYDGSAEAGLVRAYAVAVKAIGAVSECHQLGSREELSAEAASGDRQEDGFPQLLCEALSLVTDAVRTEVAPLVQQGRDDAKDVARALLDTLGVVACSVEDVLSSSAVTVPQTADVTPRRDDPAGATDAYELAMAELLAVSGSKSIMSNGPEKRDDKLEGWEMLGLPLRRRACWHLLRCVWTTSRYFRSMEDACSSSDDDKAIRVRGGDDVIRGEDDYSNDGEAPNMARTLVPLAHRCTQALWAIGQLRLPPAILTPHFKKLVANKQAEEAERPLVFQNPGVRLEATSDAPPCGDVNLERLLAVRKEEEDWAVMAENQGSQDTDETTLEDSSVRGHLMLACRVLLMCSASRTNCVRQEAAALLAEADIPGALNALQDEVASLKRELRDRETQLHRAEGQVVSLRAQVAAGAFML